MMKLIIQVPCYNEAQTLEIALNHLPTTEAVTIPSRLRKTGA